MGYQTSTLLVIIEVFFDLVLKDASECVCECTIHVGCMCHVQCTCTLINCRCTFSCHFPSPHVRVYLLTMWSLYKASRSVCWVTASFLLSIGSRVTLETIYITRQLCQWWQCGIEIASLRPHVMVHPPSCTPFLPALKLWCDREVVIPGWHQSCAGCSVFTHTGRCH